MSDEVEVLPAGIVRPQASVVELVDAQAEYRALCERLLSADDYQRVGARDFRKKSGWRKLNAAFNVTTELLRETVTTDPTGAISRAEIVVRATAPNGRHADGIGLCAVTERKFAHPTHDVVATAYTRACNRASSDLYGLGEVSAEEVSPDTDVDVALDTIRAVCRELVKAQPPEVRERLAAELPPSPDWGVREWAVALVALGSIKTLHEMNGD